MLSEKLIEQITFKITTFNDIDTVIKKMESGCELNKFALLHTYNYFEILENKGFPITTKVYIYEICRAKIASKILTVKPEFSIFMPCRVAVYQTLDCTEISTMNMTQLLDNFKENQEIYNEALDTYISIKNLINYIAS